MEKLTVETVLPQPGLDAITVFWQDFGPGQGAMTILCYDTAWTTYFGAMGPSYRNVKEFVALCDRSYLANRLISSQWMKQGKLHEKYLGRIIDAVQKALCSKERA